MMKLIDIINAIIKRVEVTICIFKYGIVSKLFDRCINNVRLERIIKVNEKIIKITFLKLKRLNLFIFLFIDNLRLNIKI